MVSSSSASRRLLLVSSRYRYAQQVSGCAAPGVLVVRYSFELSTAEDVLSLAAGALGGGRAVALACVLHGSDSELFLCEPGELTLTAESCTEEAAVRELMSGLGRLIEPGPAARLDFLDARVSPLYDGGFIARQLESLLQVRPTYILRDISAPICQFHPLWQRNLFKLHSNLKACFITNG